MKKKEDYTKKWADIGKSYANNELRKKVFENHALMNNYFNFIGTKRAGPRAYEMFSEIIEKYRGMRNKYLQMGLDVEKFDDEIARHTLNSKVLPIKSFKSPMTEEEFNLQIGKFKELK